jgi:hypothetical protein
MAMEITEGYFGDLRLDGLRVAGVYHWPGRMHEGNGTWWSIIDKRATQEQVEALFKIFGGEEQEPTTGFAIYGSTVANEPDPIFADIDFEFDLDACRGKFSVNGVMGAELTPIKNPVTGEDHFITINPREGFEFRAAEMVSADYWANEILEAEHRNRFGTITFASYGPRGIIPEESLPARRG